MSKAHRSKVKNIVITGLIAVIAVGIASRYASSNLPGSTVAGKALGG